MTLRIEESQKTPGTFHVYDSDASGSGPRVAVLIPEGPRGPAVVQRIAALLSGEPRTLSVDDAALLGCFAQTECAFVQACNSAYTLNLASPGTASWPDSAPLEILRAELRRRGVLP